MLKETELSAGLIQLGHTPCVFGIALDVTEAKVMEQQLWRAQKLEALGRLAGGMAHDFNNLVMVFNGYAHLIKDAAEENQRIVTLADQLLTTGDRAAAVTKQLLAFSRNVPQEHKVVDLNEIVSQFCKMLAPFIRENIDMAVSPEATPAIVVGDAHQIEQIIMNFVVNARDAMPRGGRLTIATKNVVLKTACSMELGAVMAAGRYVILTVSDTGVGMDQETQRRIFAPFFTTKESGKGTGLGLATVHRIVTQMHGGIEVFSEAGKGTTFNVYFPFVDANVKVESQDGALDITAAGGSETILFVEDQESLRIMVAEYLSSRGYKVLQAADGAAALKICRNTTQPIHILVTDVVMPEMTGPEFVRAALKFLPGVRVIFMSGYDSPVTDIGPNVNFLVLQKPVGLPALLMAIRSSLDETKKAA